MLLTTGAHIFKCVGIKCACAPCHCPCRDKVLLHQASEEAVAQDGEADGGEKPAKRAKTGDGEKEEKKDREETNDVDMKDAEKQVWHLPYVFKELHKRAFTNILRCICCSSMWLLHAQIKIAMLLCFGRIQRRQRKQRLSPSCLITHACFSVASALPRRGGAQPPSAWMASWTTMKRCCSCHSQFCDFNGTIPPGYVLETFSSFPGLLT